MILSVSERRDRKSKMEVSKGRKVVKAKKELVHSRLRNIAVKGWEKDVIKSLLVPR